MTGPESLSPEALEQTLRDLPGWRVETGKLVREIRTADWRETLFLVNGIAAIAEAAHHHPDLQVAYRTVRVELWTHETGGLTSRDVSLARRLERWLAEVLD